MIIEAEPLDVILMLHEDIPDEIESDTRAHLDWPGLNLRIMRQSGLSAGVTLYLPTAAALVIAAGFFNGFLQRAGEDCYNALKLTANALWRRTEALSFVATGTPGKVSSICSCSLTYSIIGEILPGLSFKFLVQTDIDQQDAEEGIGAFLDLIDDVHSGRMEKTDWEALLTYRPVGGMVLVTYDATRRKIVPVNSFGDRA